MTGTPPHTGRGARVLVGKAPRRQPTPDQVPPTPLPGTPPPEEAGKGGALWPRWPPAPAGRWRPSPRSATAAAGGVSARAGTAAARAAAASRRTQAPTAAAALVPPAASAPATPVVTPPPAATALTSRAPPPPSSAASGAAQGAQAGRFRPTTRAKGAPPEPTAGRCAAYVPRRAAASGTRRPPRPTPQWPRRVGRTPRRRPPPGRGAGLSGCGPARACGPAGGPPVGAPACAPRPAVFWAARARGAAACGRLHTTACGGGGATDHDAGRGVALASGQS